MGLISAGFMVLLVVSSLEKSGVLRKERLVRLFMESWHFGNIRGCCFPLLCAGCARLLR